MSAADTDAMLNRVNVALARSQRLMESWLPPAAVASSSSASTGAAPTYDPADQPLLERPEHLGVGAPLPAEGAGRLYASRDGGLAGLSKQLGLKAPRARGTGKGVADRKAGDAAAAPAAPGEKESRRGELRTKQDVESEDDEGGRTSAVGRAKKPRGYGAEAGHSTGEQMSRPKKRSVTYLDEMLGARMRKRGAGKGKVDD